MINSTASAVEVKAINALPESELIQKIINGETSLFKTIIRKNNPFLHKIGRSYGFNHEDTQDLMQETFVSAYFNLSKFENRSSLKTWLIKIMLRNCFRKKQKSSYQYETPGIISDNSIPMFSNHHEHDADKMIINSELNRAIEKALVKLPLEYRMTFSLREINGLSVAETSEALDITESNVKVRVNRAKIMLRKELEKTYSAQDIFDFNLIYCEAMVEKVMKEIRVSSEL